MNPGSVNPLLVRFAVTRLERCRCPDPMPVERAVRKGAAVLVCRRCGLRPPARLRR